MISQDDEEKTVVALKNILAPFILRRKAQKTFSGKKREDFMIWLPLSPWQEVLCDTVREKEVERWAGVFGINPMNGLCQRAAFRCFSFRLSSVRVSYNDRRCVLP